jgi:hypothetical protein
MNAAGDGLKPTHPVRRSEIDPGSGLPNEERPLAFSSPLSSPVTHSSTIPFLYPSASTPTPVLLFRLLSTLTIPFTPDYMITPDPHTPNNNA